MMALTEPAGIRTDKQIILLVVIFCLGWATATAIYQVPWLQYRSTTLNSENTVLFHKSGPLPTASIVPKAKVLAAKVDDAKNMGCIQ